MISLSGNLFDYISKFTTYHPHYKEKLEMKKFIYDRFSLRPPPKLLSLPNILYNCVVKFATYHPHYKKKPRMIESRYNLFLLRSSSKLILSLHRSSDYIIKVFATYHLHYKDKLRKTPRFVLDLFSYPFQLLSPSFSLMFSEMHPTIIEC